MATESDPQEIRAYYDDLYGKEQEDSMRPVNSYDVFINILNPVKGGKILDIGCGPGNLLKNAEINGLIPFGLDISMEALKIAKRNSPLSTLLLACGEKLPFGDDFFDYVTCMGSLEHFTDMNEALKEMIRVSKKNAKFCIMVPNIDYKFGAGTGQIEEKLLTLDEWKGILEQSGMRIIKIKQDKYFGKVLTWKKIVSQKGVIGKLRLGKRKLLWTFMPLDKTYQFIFICGAK
jgi:SAM-dependent methyltransferase